MDAARSARQTDPALRGDGAQLRLVRPIWPSEGPGVGDVTHLFAWRSESRACRPATAPQKAGALTVPSCVVTSVYRPTHTGDNAAGTAHHGRGPGRTDAVRGPLIEQVVCYTRHHRDAAPGPCGGLSTGRRRRRDDLRHPIRNPLLAPWTRPSLPRSTSPHTQARLPARPWPRSPAYGGQQGHQAPCSPGPCTWSSVQRPSRAATRRWPLELGRDVRAATGRFTAVEVGGMTYHGAKLALCPSM